MTLELAISLVFSLVLHELAHGVAALRQGDPTALLAGRLSVNPLRHVSPLGTVVLPALALLLSGGKIVVGWLAPMPVIPENMRDPRRGMLCVALAGPAANAALAVLCLALSTATDSRAVVQCGLLNAGLAAINLLPIRPLDGWHIVHHFATRKEHR